ncbi:MAG: VOC family protein [Candidatus Bathyarchaeia archaeon]
MPEIEELITFLYYSDLEKAVSFYEDVLGLKLSMDQGWAKIFRVAENSYLGLVDGDFGYHTPSQDKPVMITLVVPDVDEWYEYLQDRKIATLTEPKDNEELNIRMFLLEDPEGYVIEIQKFY